MEMPPLHLTLGVEVSSPELAGDISYSEIENLRTALAQHQPPLFRMERRLLTKREVEIAGRFGPPAVNGGEKARSVLHSDDAAGRDPAKGLRALQHVADIEVGFDELIARARRRERETVA